MIQFIKDYFTHKRLMWKKAHCCHIWKSHSKSNLSKFYISETLICEKCGKIVNIQT